MTIKTLKINLMTKNSNILIKHYFKGVYILIILFSLPLLLIAGVLCHVFSYFFLPCSPKQFYRFKEAIIDIFEYFAFDWQINYFEFLTS